MPLTPEQVAKQKKRIVNPDKSVSTERSITIQTDKGFINIPTIIDGKQFSNADAISYFKKNGGGSSPFSSKEQAVSSAKKRSKQIGNAIKKQKWPRLSDEL